jgi:hypothetical protein
LNGADLISAREQALKGELLQKIEKLVKASTDLLVVRRDQSQLNWQTLTLENRNLKRGCNCPRVSDFMRDLSDLGVLPIATAMKNTNLWKICESLSRLSPGGYSAPAGSPPAAPFDTPLTPVHTKTGDTDLCPACKEGFYEEVRKSLKDTEAAVKGFCLDCLNEQSPTRFKPCEKLDDVWHFNRQDM